MSMYNKKTIEDIDVRASVCSHAAIQRAIENGTITDDKRIVEALPTIKYLSEHGAKVILCSHWTPKEV